MQRLVIDINRKYNKTFLFVTHNIEEAIFLADKIYILSSRPARIIKIVDNPLSRNRDLGIKKTKRFISLEAEIARLEDI
jgi:NitT/TauT family transport system ATP-binding protein